MYDDLMMEDEFEDDDFEFEDEDDFLDEDEDLEDWEDFSEEDSFEFEDDDYDDMEDEGYDDFGEFEDGDEFSKKWRRKWRRRIRKGLGKLGRLAKKHAGKIGSVIGGAFGGPAGAAIGGGLGRVVKNLEDEDDYDTEDEMEATMPISPVDDGMAEAMASAASKARPSDAQALGGAIAITITSRAPMAVKTVAPGIANASGRIARRFAATRSSKPLIKALPTIVKATTATLAKKSQKGKPVTKRVAARVMTKQAKKTLRSSRRLSSAMRRNAIKKRRVNRAAIAKAERFY